MQDMHDTKVSTTFFTNFVFFVSDYVHAMYSKVVKLFLGGNAFIKYYMYEYCYWFWLPLPANLIIWIV